MAVTTSVIQSALSASGGTTDFTTTGRGAPTGAIIQVCEGNTTNNPADDAMISIGFWDGTNQRAMGHHDRHGLSTTITKASRSESRGVIWRDENNNQHEYTVSAITDGIRLTHTVDNTALARYCTVTLIWGVTTEIVTITNNNTEDATTTSSTLGIEPTGIIFASAGLPSANTTGNNFKLGLGVAVKNGNKQLGMGSFSRVNVTTTERTSFYSTNRCGIRMGNDGATQYTLEVTDWGTDTFELTTRDGTGSTPHFALVFADNALDAFSDDTPTSTGTVDHTTNVNVQSLFLLGMLNNSGHNTTSDSEGLSLGMSDGTNDYCNSLESEDGATTSSSGSTSYTDRVLDINNAEVSGGKTNRVQATVDSFSGRTVTLDYSVVDTSARGIIGITIGDPVSTATAALTLGSLSCEVSATYEAPTRTATAALTLGSLSCEVSATYEAPTRTATSGLTLPSVLLSASATEVNPVYDATAALTLGAALLAASATETDPVYSATSELTLPALSLSASATETHPVYSATSSLTLGAPSLSASASFEIPTFTATSTLTLGSLLFSASGTFVAETFTATSVLVLPVSLSSASGTFSPPIFASSSSLNLAVVLFSSEAPSSELGTAIGSGALTLPSLLFVSVGSVDSFVPGTGGIVNRMRQQVCVWWKMTGTDEFGAPVFETPVEITCRWEWKRMKVVMPRYETFTSKAKVYVERPIEVGDYLYLGSLSEIAGETDPRVIKDAVRVKKYGEISNLRGQADRVLRYANA